MGGIGDINGEIKPSELNPSTDSLNAETQPFEFDSQFPVLPFEGDTDNNEDDHELNYLQDTVPLDDNNVTIENEFETQCLNLGEETQVCLNHLGEETQETQVCLNHLGEETQVCLNHLGEETQETQVCLNHLGEETQVCLNLGEETQVLNLGDETQVLDDFDCCENIETQLLDEFDVSVGLDSESEGTDETEVLNDGDDVSDNEVVSGDHGRSFGHEEKKESLEQCNASTDEQRNSGIHVPATTPDVKALPEWRPGSVRRFASVRAASVRASGLAARNAALQEMKIESCSNRTDNQFSDQCTVDSKDLNPKVMNISQPQDQGNYDKNSTDLRYGIDFKVGCPTARKLFADDYFSEHQGLPRNSENANAGEDLLEVPDCDGPLAGLSYIDSQEPGELSQANALDFVERFVNDNLMELDDEVDFGKSARVNSKLISCAKGPQSLAKKTIERNTVAVAGNFEWDDFREDEGGGDIYRRMKEEFYGNSSHAQKSFTQPLKPKGRKLDESCNKDQPTSGDKMTVHSDSKLLLCKSKDNENTIQEGQMEFRKNLSNEFDEQFHLDSSRGQLEVIGEKTCAAEELNDVGFDTQIAAEAIEALFYGEAVTDPKPNQGVESISKGSFKGSVRGKFGKRVSSIGHTSKKGVSCSGAARFTRQSKRTKSSEESSVLLEKHSKNVRKECDTEVLLPKLKKAKYWGRSTKKRHPDEVRTITPIAHRTRQSSVKNMQMAETRVSDCRKGRKQIKEVDFLQESRTGSTDVRLSKVSNAKGKLSILHSDQSVESGNVNCKPNNDVHLELIARSTGNCALSYPKQKRSFRKMPVDLSESAKMEAQPQKLVQSDDNRQSIAVPKRPRGSNRGKSKIGPEAAKTNKLAGGNPDAISSLVAESLTSNKSPKKKSRSPGSICTTPANCPTPINAASPVCMGDEYFKQSCKKNLLKSSLIKELRSLSPIEPEPISPLKDMRKRKNLSNLRVLFSNHLDEDILKQQKKILARLSISEASTIVDATHFITDKFVRTRNMLEVIACGKPVVTHLWLESIGQVNIHIDEEAYVLRDLKKEKELGFCMPVSLARARKRSLLQGQRVFITPNTKPGIGTISHLVSAVHGQTVERIDRSTMKDDNTPDDLLILSCEEDYEICVPFLEKGAYVYSSELLLNGIVTQKLDYGRHRLFEDHVRRTRSTTHN